jgi:polyribonucleotide nucleotidyltransferase
VFALNTRYDTAANVKRALRVALTPPYAPVALICPPDLLEQEIDAEPAAVTAPELLHISKIGGGKRIDRVEDVLNLGDEVEVRVDDIDQSGKLSLSLVGEENDDDRSGGRGGGGGESRERSSRPPRDRDDAPRGRRGDGEGDGNGESRSSASSGSSKAASFEDSWDAQVREEFGDLGPAEASRSGSGGGGGGGRRGGGGGRRRR